MRFVRQTQMISVINFDNRLMIEKKIRKHIINFYTRYHLRSVKLWQDKCVDKLAGKSTRRKSITLWERIHILEIASTISEYRYLKNLFEPIEEVGYFTYSNNSDIISSEMLPNFIFIFDDVACDKQDKSDKRVLFNGSTRVSIAFISVRHMQRYQSVLYATTQISWILFKQDGINLKHVYNDHVNTNMSYEDFCKLCRNC